MKLYKNFLKNYVIEIFYFSPKEIIYFHNLRVLALLMVISLHIANSSKYFVTSYVLSVISENFFFSIDILFVLSGYFSFTFFNKNTITKKLILHFYIQRIIKILPIYIFAFLVYYFLTLQEYNKFLNLSKINNTEEILFWSNFFKNKIHYWWGDLLFVSNYTPTRIINVGWFISTVIQYYLLLPFLVIFANKLKNLKFLFWIAIYLLVSTIRLIYFFLNIDLEKIYFYSHTRLDSFVIGILIAEILKDNLLKEKLKIFFQKEILNFLLYFYFIVSFYIILIYYDKNFQIWNYALKYNYNNLFLFIFILKLNFINSESNLYKIFNFPYLVFISKMSYTLFLLHEYFIIILSKKISFQLYTEIDVYKFILILLPFAIAIGYPFYLIFEQPFLTIKKKLRSKIE